MSILNKFLGDPNQRRLDKLQPLVEKINQLEPEFERFSDIQLKSKSEEFKKQLVGLEDEALQEKLNEFLPEAFALAREAAKRTIGQRHFDAQLIGGIVLHQGQIAEMKTGEGKTLAATAAIYLNALTGKGVHLITVNDYLARRDTNWMGPIYYLLGLRVGCLNHEKSYVFEPQSQPDKNEVTVEMENLKNVSRQEAYAADITYGTNNEFGFDYLRDNMAPAAEAMAQRQPYFAIIDEVDSILIDEARTPLIISMPDMESTKLYDQFSRLVPHLKENTDYNIDEKMRAVTLTEEGIARVEKKLGLGNIYQEGGIRHVHHLEEALKAHILFKRDRDYIVKNGQVIIVDEFTGRLMPGRRYSGGLHQALEAKEKVYVQPESRTLASITFQNLFRMYPKLAGMTGTALTSAEEFHKVYNLEVVVIPTNKPMIRQDLPDRIYKSTDGKFKALVKEIEERYQKGQPVLVGTVSIEKNELLSVYLQKEGIPHKILNAKNHEEEAKIIAQAGQKGAVTVATNMAGRGVDIILGGYSSGKIKNPARLASQGEAGGQKSKSKNNEEDLDRADKEWKKEHDEIVGLGGLHIIGTERHEARRIDNQLRGRSGRQGDPGSSQFFVSLEDDLMRVFGGERVKSMMEILKVPENQPIESGLISKAIESAQSKIEGFNFDIRKHVLEYDDVMNKQREIIYKKRRQVLFSANLKEQILEMIEDEIKRIVQFHTQAPQAASWSYEEISEVIKSILGGPVDLHTKLREFQDRDKIIEYLINLAKETYQNKEKELAEAGGGGSDSEAGDTASGFEAVMPAMRQAEKFVLLRSIDMLWIGHLENMDYLRDSVRLRAYGQKDPLVEYKNEGMRLFQQLLTSIESTVVGLIYKVALAPQSGASASPSQSVAGRRSTGERSLSRSQGQPPSPGAKIGRNDPCPCGSGKKYKKCHGK